MSYRGAYIPELCGLPVIVRSPKAYDSEARYKGRCVQLSQEEAEYFNTYAQTFVARMGLMLRKYGISNDFGYPTVPLVPFDRHWTDEALAAEIGLTSEELDAIRAALPDYHGLLS